MKRVLYGLAAVALSVGAAQAQSLNKTDDPKQTSPGTTGAMGNVSANGVATDPQGVRQQQGGTTKASPGTVGASPGTTPPPQPK